MTPPTPEQLEVWAPAIEALKIWDKNNVSLFKQSQSWMLQAMCNHAGIPTIDFSCSGCIAAGLNKLSVIYKEYL